MAHDSSFSAIEAAYERTAFEQSAAGLEIYDAGLRVLRTNSAALAMRGRRAGQVLNRPVQTLGSRLPLAPLLQRVLAGGEAAVQQRIDGHDGRGHRRTFAVTAFPLEDARRTIGVGSVIHDVTDETRARVAAELLARAHEGIGTTLDAMRTARELADIAVEDFADAVSVDLVDSVLQGETPPEPPVGADVPLRRAAFETRGVLRGIYPVGETSHFVFPTPYTDVLGDVAPRLLDPRSAPADWLMHDAARAGALRAAGIHSMIIVPLSAQGRVLGLAGFYRGPRHPLDFDATDVKLAEQVSAKACIHIENARRYTRERTSAVTLQRSLLPRTFPEVSAVTTAHFHAPGSRQTVWFDVIALSGARVGLAIGQVPEQGLHATVTMGRFRTATTTLANLDLPPEELLAHLDDATHRIVPDHAARQDRAAGSADAPRCQYAVYDPVSGELAIAAAGWPVPLVSTPDGAVSRLDMPVGPPLGQGAAYEVRRTVLAPESLLTLYSESLIEPASDAAERMDQLERAAARSGQDPRAACDSIVDGLLPIRAGDGAAVLAARTHRLVDGQVATWTGTRDAETVADCRERTGVQLADWGLDAWSFTTEMVVSELVTNVLRHASGNPRVRLIHDRSLTIEVSDESSTAPHLRHARAQDETGRGLLIIASLARRWGTRYSPDGKTVWVEEPLDEPP
ncbi:SpoIIE family protein phosphatase [Streptomyces sp. IBSBF 2435]|uniref:SpoIIE family protein phosphatase n=1 Tax=Streptomyces sp. IBSBF 2435 TaxID=2903531 RepID=UPI002FDBA3D8